MTGQSDSFFCHLSTRKMVELISNAKGHICYVGPGIQPIPAIAIARVAKQLSPEIVSVWLDFDERVMRMGYGSIEAVRSLRNAGITVRHVGELRSALLIVDDEGYTFSPTAEYLEADPGETVRNALRLSREQVAEALARLSPAAKAIAVAIASTPEEKVRIASLPIEADSTPISNAAFNRVEASLKIAPPVKFDIARQVRVFEPYLQYIELSLTGAAIQRKRLTIPASIQKLGGSKDLEGRLRTTFDLIAKNSKLSSKSLDDTLDEIRNDFTRSLGKDHGRVLLKAAKPKFQERLLKFRTKLKAHQETVEAKLQDYLDKSEKEVVDYYVPMVIRKPPDALLGSLFSEKPTKEDASRWLSRELEPVFPKASSIIEKMILTERYKDVTYETLNEPDFIALVKDAWPDIDWDKAYNEFLAARETPTAEVEE